MAADARVHRFGRTERVLHRAFAGCFLAMLATGLVLYLPFLAQIVSARPQVKAVHLVAAVGWVATMLLVPLLGDRRALRAARRQLERFDEDDLAWLRARGTDRRIPQGRFNAGQKVHAVAQAALTVLFLVSGTLLWLGERHTQLRLGGTIALHDVSMLVGGLFVAGHVFMAFAPETRAAREGMRHGTVPRSYARAHHAKWAATAVDPPVPPARPAAPRLAAAALVAVLALTGAALLVRDTLGPSARRPPSAAAAASASRPAGTSAGSGTGTAAARSPR
ncbi:cytochrome b/b6 domain-containing protein [Paraconexibacter antarcticus]|uniref:Cytochrome b/b6 domain-containing protein n=1 Tax=Paraconexibacter antarcticus TaxID=2949664 RepID=A0ABY5DU34_9ACTN|nr:cytochrome b/b6 domain-containing protein [Paraconexibacter antarcticus]UTI64059.1 cytochrome b/b6 domain-containing protein [Paraconexibacter antarcticus]